MNLESFNLLKRRFEDRRFESSQKTTKNILYASSWIGNIFSVLFAFFFVSKLTENAATHFAYQEVILPAFIIVFLSMFELMKRFVFGNIVSSYIIVKKVSTNFLLSLLFALVLIGSSFYLSMSGAQSYVNKDEQIVNVTDSISSQKVDSLNKMFNVEISKLEGRINYIYTAAESRKKKSLTTIEIESVKEMQSEINNVKKERDSKTKQEIERLASKSNTKLVKSNKSQFAFLLISAFIELIILIGVCFGEYYDHTCYKEAKRLLDEDSNYSKLETNLELLNVLFNNGKVLSGSALPVFNQIKQIVSTSGVRQSDKNLKDFLTLLNYLKITNTIGKTKYFAVNFETAKERITSHLPLKINKNG